MRSVVMRALGLLESGFGVTREYASAAVESGAIGAGDVRGYEVAVEVGSASWVGIGVRWYLERPWRGRRCWEGGGGEGLIVD